MDKTNKPAITGRTLFPDPAAPGIPAHDGMPAVPAGWREATEDELREWVEGMPYKLAGIDPPRRGEAADKAA